MAIAPAPVLVDTSPHTISWTVTEDGNAVNTVQLDVPAVLVAGPLNDLIAPAAAIANQAAARVLVEQNCDLVVYKTAGTQAGATGGAQLTVIPNVQGAAAGNFRLDLAALKAANADTGAWVIRLSFRHSLIN